MVRVHAGITVIVEMIFSGETHTSIFASQRSYVSVPKHIRGMDTRSREAILSKSFDLSSEKRSILRPL